MRHAETDSNASVCFQGWADVELNENGYFQALRVAEQFSRMAIDAVYTSPLKRAAVTADFIAARHALNPLSLTDLAEINLGAWEGKNRSEVGEKWPELLWKMQNDPVDLAIPGGETFTLFSDRCINAFWQIVNEQVGKKAIVVAHSGTIRAILVNILSGVTANWGKLDIDNTSITTVKIDDNKLHIVSINNTSHLATLNQKGGKTSILESVR